MPATGHRLDGLVTAINEAVAETSEELMEKYFSGEPLTKAEIVQGIKSGVKDGTITPVVCGVATKLEAIDMVLDVINDLAPTPQDTENITCLGGGKFCNRTYIAGLNTPGISLLFTSYKQKFTHFFRFAGGCVYNI